MNNKRRNDRRIGVWLKSLIVLSLFSLFFSQKALGQIDGSKAGAWYMYFWEWQAGEKSFGVQGDFQFRNWNLIGDLEQLLLRGGIYYQGLGSKWRFTTGYANIRSGEFGESKAINVEHRIYQEAIYSHQLKDRIKFIHRLRIEERFIEGSPFRTRGRYNLFANIVLNNKGFNKGCIYLALYNELFINGERTIDGENIGFFDRNRSYGAIGYQLSQRIKIQMGYMQQITKNWSKGQFQLSLHHKL